MNPLPLAQMGWDMGCVTKPVHFEDLSDGMGADIVSWQWGFDDPNSCVIPPVHKARYGFTIRWAPISLTWW